MKRRQWWTRKLQCFSINIDVGLISVAKMTDCLVFTSRSHLVNLILITNLHKRRKKLWTKEQDCFSFTLEIGLLFVADRTEFLVSTNREHLAI